MIRQRAKRSETAAIGRRDRQADRLKRRLTLARLSLGWEALWPLLWPLPALLALFLGLALLDLLPLLPGWLHALVLAAFVAAAAAASYRLGRFRRPTAGAVLHRLEIDSGLSHRPLQTLSDQLVAGTDDPLSQALWQLERQRVRRLLDHLRTRLPSPGLARHDPWGLRFAALMLLLVAASGGWQDAGARLRRAVLPHLDGLAGPSVVLQVWITPPAYTGIAPMLLESLPAGQRLRIPTGSRLLAQLQGGRGQAQLLIDDAIQPFQALDADSQRLETTVDKGRRLTIRQGRRRVASWPLALLEDHPPAISFAAPPEADAEGRLRLEVEAHDDYGVTRAWAIIHRQDSPQAEPVIVGLPLGGGHPTDVHQASWHDLTGNPWAGLKVSIQPAAEDGAGQKATGEAVTTVLPERRFTHPVARAIIEQRHHLAEAPNDREPVMNGLADIASEPDRYADDLTTFLALSTARSRLRHDLSDDAVPSVLDMLWQTALRIEEGDRPAAQRALDQAARDLDEALANGAPEAELERLMNQLQAAMAQYLDALAEEAARQGAPPAAADQPVISADELQQMVERMRDLSHTGSRQAAQEMLAQLRQMLDGLRMGATGQAGSEQAHQARQAMNELDAVTRGQRGLLDETFRHSREGQPGLDPDVAGPNDLAPLGQPGRSAKQPKTGRDGNAKNRQESSDRQEALRKRLGQVMQSLGDLGADIPDALGQAEQAMRDSTEGLQSGDMQQAVDAQSEAVARLLEGARQAMQALSQQLGGNVVRGPGGAGRDPLGRRLPGAGAFDENNVKIPNQADLQKAREVLDELRRRSGQADRPLAERDYLQRLLKELF